MAHPARKPHSPAAAATQAAIEQFNFVLLEDDGGLAPAQNIIPVLSQDLADAGGADLPFPAPPAPVHAMAIATADRKDDVRLSAALARRLAQVSFDKHRLLDHLHHGVGERRLVMPERVGSGCVRKMRQMVQRR